MKNESIDQLNWETLLNRAVDGILTDDEASELKRILKSDEERVDEYIRFVDMHGSLYHEPLLARAGEVGKLVNMDSMGSRKGEIGNIGFWRTMAAVATIAAIGAFTWSSKNAFFSDESPRYEESAYIGLVTSLKGDASISEHFVGKGLERGPFKLDSGRAQVRLDNGVELSIKGPAEFDIFGLDHITLMTGRVTANVPPRAIGFRIDTPDMEVIDLGTEFALRVDPAGESRLHVLEGEVEARKKMGVGLENVPMIIAKDSMHDLVESPSYLDCNYDPETFAPSPLKDRLIQATDGKLRSLQDSPKDLRHGRFKHDYLMIFPEKQDFVLPREVEVNLSEPGSYRVLGPAAKEMYLKEATEKQRARETMVDVSMVQSVVPAGTRVTSYLVHFDATHRQNDTYRAKGRVRFSGRVLGVILHQESLSASDDLLGGVDTIYESKAGRRMENDFIRISSDQRQIVMNFEIHGFIDQARIIVAENLEETLVADILDR
ncbi:MAG TPA: hypothetical protein DIV79_15245 [Opitutae bacterium]|nr:hypothetical protein [Opitutaceae bacterium]HCR31360.1 hypothetical protein [Opitutae bacterium]|tara:strand:- start:914 stop:2383 length:1470 start_codon:yes stop_codon:yes gene_type:complete